MLDFQTIFQINQPTFFASLLLIFAPVISFLLSWSSFFDLGKKDSEKFFEEVDRWVKKRKVDNLRNIMFPNSLGVSGENENISNENIVRLSCEIDRVKMLESILRKCRFYFHIYYSSLLCLFSLGIVLLLIFFSGFSFFNSLIKNYQIPIYWGIVLYTFGGSLLLWRKKNILKKEYEKEYNI